MKIFLRGLALQNYCGIGSDFCQISPFRACNIFIGANNAGKSAVLNFISRHLKGLSELPGGRNSIKLEPLELHLGAEMDQFNVRFGVPSEIVRDQLLAAVRNERDKEYAAPLVAQICSILAEEGLIWIGLPERSRQKWQLIGAVKLQSLGYRSAQNVLKYWNIDTQTISEDRFYELIASYCIPDRLQMPECVLIPAIRRIGENDGAEFDYSGQGLISALANLQNPGLHERDKVEQFNLINQFLQSVTDEPEARIEIPYERDHVLIHVGNKLLPLQSLGTGVHEVVMLAAFCTILTDSIVCIEEPEIHLHPLLQRKLIRYLLKRTGNQYFIATHSAAFIDTPNAAVFHVTNHEGVTHISSAIHANDRFAICQDLGYKASDLVQANAIIWVEGPSDRIYVKHWISSVADDLFEGTHYSIMFYGGRLLSHLTADDTEVGEFIELRRLNRNLAILIDSDRGSAHKPINDTKKRILREFDRDGGVAWLTKGREIENYVNPGLLRDAIRKVFGERYVSPAGVGQYDHALHFNIQNKPGKGPASSTLFTDVDKVKVAKAVCAFPADLSVLDLRKQVENLVAMIRRANE